MRCRATFLDGMISYTGTIHKSSIFCTLQKQCWPLAGSCDTVCLQIVKWHWLSLLPQPTAGCCRDIPPCSKALAHLPPNKCNCCALPQTLLPSSSSLSPSQSTLCFVLFLLFFFPLNLPFPNFCGIFFFQSKTLSHFYSVGERSSFLTPHKHEHVGDEL